VGKQLDLFKEIWAERPHVSFVSGKPVYFIAWTFAHVLSKGAYPAFKLKKENIILLTPEEHYKLDHETHKAKADKSFDKVFELASKLKTEYYKGDLYK
jgi:hypothetical protein